MNLDELLEAVEDEQTFLAFVSSLLSDHRSNADSWQSGSIEQFLDGALAWAQATNIGASQGLAAASPWRRIAVMLYCGKIYE